MKPTERVLKVVNNGIYERRVVERERRPTDWNEVQKTLCEWLSSDATFLDRMRSVAVRVLADHGIETDGELPCFTTPGGGWSRTPDELAELPEIVRDACELLCNLHGQESDTRAKLIFTAGRLFERMQVRQFEPLAKRGRTDVSARGKRRASIKNATSERRVEYLEKWRTFRADNPRKKTERIDELTAEHFGVSERTIANARRQAGLS